MSFDENKAQLCNVIDISSPSELVHLLRALMKQQEAPIQDRFVVVRMLWKADKLTEQ